MRRDGHLLDLTTQAWVRLTGRRVDIPPDSWLDGPTGSTAVVGDEWLEREAGRLGATPREGGGLLSSMGLLEASGFDPAALSPEIIDFYEQTSSHRLEVWSQWCPAMWPGGWLISTLIARRLEQLSLPMQPLDAAKGMDSRVVALERDGRQLGAAWLRRLRATNEPIYSGWYGVTQLPGCARPSIGVTFPLPNGRLVVFLEPSVGEGGALVLRSPIAPFGGNGAYLIVETSDGKAADVRRIPLAETFRVYVEDGVLRTDHELRMWRIPVIRFHYKIEPVASGSTP